MSESHRDNEKSSNNNFSHSHRNSKDDIDRHDRKRSYNDLENTDAKVFIRNIPTKKVTDDELLNFFKPYGKISDIQVFKDHISVQYTRVEDANKLIKNAKIPLLFKGNKLDVLSAREIRSTSVKSTSTDRSSKSNDRNSHRSLSNYEPQRKRFIPRERSNLISTERNDDRTHVPLSTSKSHQSSNDSISLSHQIPYAILTGPKDANALVDCQIVIVNARQRDYAEEIEARLSSQGMITSIILLREDFTLTEAIENAARLQCLYGIIAMPMHEERRTASFHILHGQTEEHRNLTLEDGIHIIATNYISYKQRLHNDDVNSYRSIHDPISYANSSPPNNSRRQLNNHTQEEIAPPVLHLGDKLPLSMLLCLLADGRQLTLEEIDRVLVYLLEKKAKMLTLPAGTLPPLPAQYATINNHQTGALIF
ncbi:unnamed protein product [Adineta ricciae]|uniref:RRM domain-containing protein n=1 Tax=Adineta ricciae TaxID=249248 RepID=A0A815ZIX7_ADIRI|nr:unnamed protein product [Adineta ricciae]